MEPQTKREVSLMLLEGNCKKYKVTRRMPALKVAETKFLETIEEAMKQLREWLQ